MSRRLAGAPALRVAAAIAAIAVLFVLPLALSNYWVTVFTSVAMLGVLAQSWNIITGYVGYPAFGNVAFFGVGAYVVALTTTKYELHLPYVVTLLLAGAAAGGFCLVLGGPLMRTRGHYFAIGTIGLAATLQQVALLVPAFTTSTSGQVIAPTFPTLFSTIERTAYYWMAGTLVLCTLCALYIGRSRIGFGLRAIRADEVAASTYGVPTVSYKVGAWAASAVFTGIAGGIWATWIGVISPTSAFDLALAVQYAVIALVGGLGTVSGPLLGALAIGLIGQTVWAQYPSVHLLVMGVIVMATVLLLPEGIMGALHRRVRPDLPAAQRSGWVDSALAAGRRQVRRTPVATSAGAGAASGEGSEARDRE